MRASLAIGMALALGTPALADVDHWWVEVENDLGADYYTFDLGVSISGDDDWTATSAVATLTGSPDCCAFYDDPIHGSDVPCPWIISWNEFDSYYTYGLLYPNTLYGDPPPGFAYQPVNEPSYKEAVWYHPPDPSNGGDGDWVIARYSVWWEEGCSPAYLLIEGETTTIVSGGQPYPFSLQIPVPEPASLILLALGAVLIHRRRSA